MTTFRLLLDPMTHTIHQRLFFSMQFYKDASTNLHRSL